MTDLRKATMDYLLWLGEQDIKFRVDNSDVYDDVAAHFLDGVGELELLSRDEVQAVRRFLWLYQYGCCAISGKRIPEKDAVLEHCHRTGRCRSVASRSWNSAEGGYVTGLVRRVPPAQREATLRLYRDKYGAGIGMLYPDKLTSSGRKKRG
ncbi:hypothetical protein Q8309_001376 [Salmonella enterica]|nr:hypothetical protein [Salmonella enterica]